MSRNVKKKKETRSGQGAKAYTPWELMDHMGFIKEFVNIHI